MKTHSMEEMIDDAVPPKQTPSDFMGFLFIHSVNKCQVFVLGSV
jgi:hypothetical protein